MRATKQITKRLNKNSSGKPTTKASKKLRISHRKDDTKLLKQDLKYNLAHAKAHMQQAKIDKQLIRKKSY